MSLSHSFSFKVNKPIKEDWKNINKFSTWFAEPKLDGCRLLYKDGQLIRENGLIKNVQYPEVLDVISKLPDGTILDGELCNLTDHFTADFNKIQHRINLKDKLRIKLLSKAEPASFVAFDILEHDGEDLTKLPLLDRIKILDSVLQKHLNQTDFQTVKQIQQFNPIELAKVIVEKKMEGMVLKDPSSAYRTNWIKMKAEYEMDCKVVGFTSETRPISALELEDLKGKYVGKCSWSKYPCTEEWAKKVVGMIAVVQYNRLTKDGKLVFPVLKELREA
jgi:ATP-dependent DNA ligase